MADDETKKIKKAVSEEVKEDPKLTDLPGIGPAVSSKLESAGIYDLMSLATKTPADISDVAGISAAVARKAIQAAREMLDLGFMEGTEYAKKRESLNYITTGSKNMNDLLGGKGVESKAITEVFGAYGSGKTQVGLTLAVNVQLPKEKGGANGKCVFIDTEGTFRPIRIKQIAESMGANPEKVLKNIFVARAFNSDHQVLLLEKVSEMIKSGEPIKLMIIDSLTAHFRAEYAGRGQLADRQQRLNRYIHDLMKLAETHNLAVYVTNQVMANPAQLFGDPTTAVGGHIVGHACLTGDSLIQMADGSIGQIKDMETGKKVFSGNFKKLRIESDENEKLFLNPFIDKIYNIATNNQIKCSSLHRFFVIDNFSVVEKEARNLKKGDFIAQAGRVEVKGKEQFLPAINIKKIGKISNEDSEKIKRELNSQGKSRKEICEKVGIKPRHLRRVLNQSYPANLDVFGKLQNHFSGKLQLQTLPVYTHKHRNMVIPDIMNTSLAQICGYFIGDGNFEVGGIRFRDERQEVLRSYKALFRDVFNINGKISKMKMKNCYSLNINSREIRDFFGVIMPNILDYVGKSKPDVVKSFIKGFVDAEGHINKKRICITIAQKNKEILRYLQLFLLRFGIRSTIKFDIGKKNMNILRITDKDVKDYMQIGFTAKDKQIRLMEAIQHINSTYSYELMPVKIKELRDILKLAGLHPSKIIRPRPESYKWVSKKELKKAHSVLMNTKIKDRQLKQKIDFIFKLLNSDIIFERIRDIRVIDNGEKELLYDFSVPGNESYVANGFIVHNSTYRIYLRRGKKDSRVAKMIDSPNLPDSETIFYISEKGIIDEI